MTSEYQDIVRREFEHGAALGLDAEDKWNWDSPAGQVRAGRRAELLFHAAHLFPGAQTFELGCGTGLFTGLMSARGVSIFAVDVSPDLITLAKERDYLSPVEFYCGDFLTLTGLEGAFDAAWGSSVLHHVPVDLFFPRILEVLKPGGWMAFAEPNMLNPQIFAERNIPAVRRWANNSPDETAFIRFSLKNQLAIHGFKDIRIMPHEWLHPAVPHPLIPAVQRFGAVLEKLPVIREFSGSLLIAARRPLAHE